jgi:hypothetical protein
MLDHQAITGFAAQIRGICATRAGQA